MTNHFRCDTGITQSPENTRLTTTRKSSDKSETKILSKSYHTELIFDDDLQMIIDKWAVLPLDVKTTIIKIIETTSYSFGAPAQPWNLYNLPRLKNASLVVVAEGEKCVEILHKYGFVSNTSPGGKGKASLTDWGPLMVEEKTPATFYEVCPELDAAFLP